MTIFYLVFIKLLTL